MLDKIPVSPRIQRLVTELYQAVDAMSIEKLGTFLAPDLRFQLGNFDSVKGKPAVLDANAAFFQIIADMAHTIDGIWSHNDDVFCKGHVHYTRLDNSKLTLPFATALHLKDDLIQDYQVYVDVTPL